MEYVLKIVIWLDIHYTTFSFYFPALNASFRAKMKAEWQTQKNLLYVLFTETIGHSYEESITFFIAINICDIL